MRAGVHGGSLSRTVEEGRVLTWTDGPSWDRFVAADPDSTVAQRWAWTEVVTGSYGHRVLPLAAVRAGELVGVLPLALIRSVLSGTVLVSMPYLDTGGVCTQDSWAERALVRHALGLAEEHGARLELRNLHERELGLAASLGKVTMTVPLDGCEDTVWARVKPNRRSQVRKAVRNGLAGEIVRTDGLDAFFHVMSVNMRDLGSPMHRRTFFDSVLRQFGDDAAVLLVRSGREVLAAGLMLFHGGRAVLPWSSCLRSARSTGANQLLYWEVVRAALDRGCDTLDLGRSSPGSGTFEAKREWGAGTVQLYWYRNRPVEALTPDRPLESRRARAAVAAWKRLPVPAATRLGGLIRGSLPQ